MACCGSSDTTTTQTSTTPLDSQIQQAGSSALQQAMNIAQQTYPGYDTDARVAPFTDDQNTAFGMIQDYATEDKPNTLNYALGQAQSYGAAPANTVTTQDVGSIQSYMDPYLAAALQPAIGDIQEASAIQQDAISANATMAGAYGDSRHGVVEAEQMQNELQQVSDLTSQAYSQSYNTALAAQQEAMQRNLQADTFNSQAQEAALQRGLQSGASSLDFSAADQQTQLALQNALLQSGQIQQGQGQAQADAQYEEYLRSLEWPFRQLEALTSIYSGQPISQTVTSSTPTDNSDLYAALGSIGGALL
jgi:hypothetical protein